MVYVFLANGFEEIEAITPIDFLRRCKIDVTTVGIGGKAVTGSHGITVEADVSSEDVEITDIDAIVLPGGMPGTTNLERSSVVRKAVSAAVENNKYICAICAAPIIPGRMGLLDGIEAVCYPGYEDQLIGAKISSKKVVVSGGYVTAKGAGVALRFAATVAGLLAGSEIAERVLDSLQC